jgi:KGK domain
MTNNLIPYDCGDDDVIAFGEAMFRSGKLKKAIAQSFDGSVGRSIDQKLRQHGLEIPVRMIGSTRLANEHCQWFEEGINCEILDLATRRWCKGKVRVQVSVEFLVEDSGDKKLLPGDFPEPTSRDRHANSSQSDALQAERLSQNEDLSSDEYVNSEYVFTGIHTNGQ